MYLSLSHYLRYLRYNRLFTSLLHFINKNNVINKNKKWSCLFKVKITKSQNYILIASDFIEWEACI